MTYRLVPLEGGYYDERPLDEPCLYVPTDDVPTIEADLRFLCSGDAYAEERADGWSLRSQVRVIWEDV